VALEWSSDKLKVLGVLVGPGDLECANWRPRLDVVLSSWRQRTLSYGGRALVVNTLALSRFWYVLLWSLCLTGFTQSSFN